MDFPIIFRPIKNKEYFNGLRYCTFCKPKKVKAMFTNKWASINYPREAACKEHTHLLRQNPPPINNLIKENPDTEKDTSEAMYSIESQFNI